jgi:hypothetical protein
MSFIKNVLPLDIKYEDLPEIKHQNSFVGYTDYLDHIYPEHLTHYVMRGKDQYDRLYLIVYYKDNIQTYFQRYPDNLELWSYGSYLGGSYKDYILKCSGNISKQPESMTSINNVITELLNSNKIKK